MSPKASSGAPPRTEGGRPAPLLSPIWAPVAMKAGLALVAVTVLAFVGARAGANGTPPAALAASAAPAALSVPVPRVDDAPRGVRPAAPADEVPAASPAPDAGEQPSRAILPDGRVVLNLASEEDLKKLPGIGPKRAQAILALRQRLVRFRAVEDLLRVKGLGRKTLQRIKPKVVLNGPS